MDAMDVDSVLADFLLDMDALERQSLLLALEECLDSPPSEPLALQSSAPATSVKSTKQTPKKRVGRRHQIAALQEEVDALMLQLTRLSCEKLLTGQRVLQQNAAGCPVGLAHWKQQAQEEESAKQSSEGENGRLSHCIEANARRIENIRRFLIQQTSSSPQRSLESFVLADGDDAFVYRMLKENVSIQHAQLDAVLAQCVSGLNAASHRESCIHTDGAGIDVRSLSISPFPIAVLNEAMRRYTQERHTQASIGTAADGDVYMRKFIKPLPIKGKKTKSRHQTVVSSPVMRGRSVFRRIASDDFLVFIWASMLDWQDEASESSVHRPTICKNGWSVIKPLSRYTDDASFKQSVESTNIYRSDGSSRHQIDSETNDVLRLIESYSKEESQIIENLAFDASMARRSVW